MRAPVTAGHRQYLTQRRWFECGYPAESRTPPEMTSQVSAACRAGGPYLLAARVYLDVRDGGPGALTWSAAPGPRKAPAPMNRQNVVVARSRQGWLRRSRL